MSRKTKTTAFVSAAFAVGLLVFTGSAQATILGPYTADAHTLHLYHLNETGIPFVDSVSSGNIDMGYIYLNGSGTYPGSTAYSPAFGSSLYAPGAYSGGNTLGGIGYDDLDTPFTQSHYQGADGSYTYEALIKVATLPTSSIKDRVIFARAGDDNFDPLKTACFQFRLHYDSSLHAVLQYEKIWDSSGINIEGITAAVPLTGDNAWDANSWFHVAVTYDGASETAKLYWTKMSDTLTEANLLTTGSFSPIPGTINGVPSIACRQAIPNGKEPLRGYIDEVRVSDIARGADQMMFGVPEPSTLALLATGLIGLLAYAWRKRK